MEGLNVKTKALFIKRGKIKDLGDLLQIARTEGKKALRVDKVHVSPTVHSHGEDYVVVVSASCSNTPVVGRRNSEN